MDAEGRRRRARVAIMRRHHPDRPELVADDQRKLKEAALERRIREVVDTWPPLTAAQRARLAALLTTGGEASG
jgi:hypothetical protein